jgi:hypothetical protein
LYLFHWLEHSLLSFLLSLPLSPFLPFPKCYCISKDFPNLSNFPSHLPQSLFLFPAFLFFTNLTLFDRLYICLHVSWISTSLH